MGEREKEGGRGDEGANYHDTAAAFCAPIDMAKREIRAPKSTKNEAARRAKRWAVSNETLGQEVSSLWTL
jgi:hypothetical protein